MVKVGKGGIVTRFNRCYSCHTFCLGLSLLFQADNAYTQLIVSQLSHGYETVWHSFVTVVTQCDIVVTQLSQTGAVTRKGEKFTACGNKANFPIFFIPVFTFVMANCHYFKMSLKFTTKPSPSVPFPKILGRLNLLVPVDQIILIPWPGHHTPCSWYQIWNHPLLNIFLCVSLSLSSYLMSPSDE